MGLNNVHILMGLPGSGKSTWANQFKKSNPNTKILRYGHLNYSIMLVALSIQLRLKDYDNVILDDLYLDNNELEDLVKNIKRNSPNSILFLHYWPPNITQCVENDIYRGRPILLANEIIYAGIDDPRTSKILVGLVKSKTIKYTLLKRNITMPLKRCSSKGKSGWKYGDSGKCYTGVGAKKRAIRQGVAIHNGKWADAGFTTDEQIIAKDIVDNDKTFMDKIFENLKNRNNKGEN